MNLAAASRSERLFADATGSLDPARLWLAAACIPDDWTQLKIDLADPLQVQSWLRSETGIWPAPLSIGAHLLESARSDRMVFAPLPDHAARPSHHVELHADGSSLMAVEIGTLKDPAAGQDPVWAIGEGSIAWLTVCFARCAAQWAAKAGAKGQASIALRPVLSGRPEDQAALQLWNFAGGANAPCGDVRQTIQPSARSFDVAAGCTGDVVAIARALLLPLLAQFGLPDSRHLGADGTIVSTNFVGHAPQIVAWAHAIGARSIASLDA